MVTIPTPNDPTLEAMYAAIKELPREDRQYLGASEIGQPCARRLWYSYNNYERVEFENNHIGLMAADSGHYAEAKTAERLRMVEGIELHTHMSNGEQYGWSAYDGKMQGHVDGLIRGLLQAPKAIHVWEHKDKDQSKFVNFQTTKHKFGEKNTLKNWDEVYYGQAQINMHFLRKQGIDVSRHYLTVSYAGARKYDSCRTEYNQGYAEHLEQRGKKLLDVTVPPPRINETPDYYVCKMCPYRKVCHEN